jgi:hypothetical protein
MYISCYTSRQPSDIKNYFLVSTSVADQLYSDKDPDPSFHCPHADPDTTFRFDGSGTPTKRQISKRQVSKRLKRQVYKTSALQKVRFTKLSGLQNVRSSKRLVAKKHPYRFCTCGWWKSAGSVAAMFARKVMTVFYSLF